MAQGNKDRARWREDVEKMKAARSLTLRRTGSETGEAGRRMDPRTA